MTPAQISRFVHDVAVLGRLADSDRGAIPESLAEDVFKILLPSTSEHGEHPRPSDRALAESRSAEWDGGVRLALAYFAVGSFQRAMTWVSRGLRLAPHHALFRSLAVSVALRQGDALEAACHLMNFWNTRPGVSHPEAELVERAYSLILKGNVDNDVLRESFASARKPWDELRSNGRFAVGIPDPRKKPGQVLTIEFVVDEPDSLLAELNSRTRGGLSKPASTSAETPGIRFRFRRGAPQEFLNPLLH